MTSSIHLPEGVTSRIVPVKDLQMHILDCGGKTAPLILLLHGFPELSYSWRAVMVPLAQAGYRVVAPDLRGVGRTVSRVGPAVPISYDDDVQSFRLLNLVADIVGLTSALGYKTVDSVVGHDFGSIVAASCALVRPDIFRSVVMMSAPYPGPPKLPFNIDAQPVQESTNVMPIPRMDDSLEKLSPPRKHYFMYFCGPTANRDMLEAPQGLRAFLRAYFHIKSGDWEGNDPHPLPSQDAPTLATMPHYYIMPLEATMAEVAQANAPTAEEAAKNAWFTESDLDVYTAEYGRTGFQGGLNWYRILTDNRWLQDLAAFSGKTIDVPAMFLSGNKDWGVYQNPGAVDRLRYQVCSRMADEDFVLVEGAGHWVQQEAATEVVEHIKRFVAKVNS